MNARALLLTLAACATVPTAVWVSRRLDWCLRFSTIAPCECVDEARLACRSAGFEESCYADGWGDADVGDRAWKLAVCQAQEEQARRAGE